MIERSMSIGLTLMATAMLACGGDSPTTPEPPDFDTLTFAPELGVDLSLMTLEPSGLYYRDLVVGEGQSVDNNIGVRFNYQGWLHDGTPVDQGIYPFSQFAPGAVMGFDGESYYLVGSGQTIAAWDLGLPGMRVGGVRQLVVPPILGFGGLGSGDGRVPANAVLVYEFELLAIEP